MLKLWDENTDKEMVLYLWNNGTLNCSCFKSQEVAPDFTNVMNWKSNGNQATSNNESLKYNPLTKQKLLTV